MNKINTRILASALCLVLISCFLFQFASLAEAASLTALSDTLSRQKASEPSNHTIKFRTPTGAETSTDTITLTFPAGFTVTGVVAADIDLSHGSSTGAETDETVSASAGAGAWGASFTDQVLTLTAPSDAASGEIAANDYVIVEIGTNATTGGTGTHQIANAGAGDNYNVLIAGTFGDTGSIGLSIITDDQLVVNASTDPTISFSLAANTLNLGALSLVSITTGTVNIAAATNAIGGYDIKYSGDTLKSGSNSIDAFASGGGASSVGNEQFGMRVSNTSGGSGAAVSPYDGSNYAFDTNSLTTPVKIAGATGPSLTTTYTVTYGANISAVTEAGKYTTTHTWICTGNF